MVQCLFYEDLLFLIVTIYASKRVKGMSHDQPYSFFFCMATVPSGCFPVSEWQSFLCEAGAHGVQSLMDCNQGYKSQNLCLRPAPWLLTEQHDPIVRGKLENRCWQEVVLIMKHGKSEWCNNSLGD